MTWRDLQPLDDWYEMQRPAITGPGDRPGLTLSEVTLTITDAPTREWYTEWLRSKASWVAFTAWADGKR